MEHHYEDIRSQNNECMSMQVGAEVRRDKDKKDTTSCFSLPLLFLNLVRKQNN